MRILDIHKTEDNTYSTGQAKVELTLGEIIFITNAIFEYCENHNESKNVYDNPVVNKLYYNLEAIRDVLKYGEVTIDTVRFWNEELSRPTEKEIEENIN